MKLTTTINYKADKEYVGINATGAKVDIDMYDADEKKAMSPTEMLLTSVAACAMVDISLMLRKRRKTLVDFNAESSGNRRAEHPRAFTDIHIHFVITSPDATEDEVAKLVDLSVEKYCSVAATLKGGPELTHSFEVVRPQARI